MSSRRIVLFCLFLLAAPAWAQESPATEAAPEAPLQGEKIEVVGQRPGPGLWKVSKGEHVLWIFGTYSPLPKKMAWRTQEIDAILAQSQEYIDAPSATTDVGFFRALTLLPLAIGIEDNPDGATLKDVLPPEVYARWLPLKEKYLGKDDSIERKRPIFVADRLYWAALRKAGLELDTDVRKSIEASIKKNKLKITKPSIVLPLDNPRAMIKDFKKSSLDDVACFSTTLARLETDIDAMRERANAWAKGDIGEITRLSFPDPTQACKTAMTSSPALKNSPAFQTMEARMAEAWVAAVEKALDTNRSTFAMMRMHNLLDAKGVLRTLEAKGYQVTQPE